MVKIGKIDAYVAEPKASEAHSGAAVLYLADVFGIWPNSKLIADQYAANGYLCVVPDLFNGDQLPEDGLSSGKIDVMKWLQEGSDGKNPHTPETVDPIVAETLKWLKSEKGATKIGASGYCFGAKVCRHKPNFPKNHQ